MSFKIRRELEKITPLTLQLIFERRLSGREKVGTVFPSHPLTGKFLGRKTPLKILYTKSNLFHWRRLFRDIFSLGPARIWYQETNILFWEFSTNKNLTKICLKKLPVKFITAWLLQTATFIKDSAKDQYNITQALLWNQESRISSVKTWLKLWKNG